MSASRLEEALDRIGPVMGQLFGQSEAPMMISTTAPADHFHADGSLVRERLSSAGRPTPLTVVAIMDDDGKLLGPGQRGEIVVRGPLVAAPGGALPSADQPARMSRTWVHATSKRDRSASSALRGTRTPKIAIASLATVFAGRS
jgi:fatty-acyl-CoA synthase